MRYFSILMLLSLLIPQAEALTSDAPAWVKNPAGSCNKSEICFLGEGQNYGQALRAGRSQLAKYFKVQVKAKYSEVYGGKNDEVELWSSDQIEEKTAEILYGVDVKSYYVSPNGTYYALVYLNKKDQLNAWMSELSTIDAEMKSIYDNEGFFGAIRLEVLWPKRENLAFRIKVLNGKPQNLGFSQKKILARKRALQRSVNFHVESNNENLKQVLISKFSINGLIDRENAKYTRNLTANTSFEEVPIKVKGFQKSIMTTYFELTDENGKTLHSVYDKFVITGRDDSSIEQKGLEHLENFIQEKVINMPLN